MLVIAVNLQPIKSQIEKCTFQSQSKSRGLNPGDGFGYCLETFQKRSRYQSEVLKKKCIRNLSKYPQQSHKSGPECV